MRALKILIIEDEPKVADFLHQGLEKKVIYPASPMMVKLAKA